MASGRVPKTTMTLTAPRPVEWRRGSERRFQFRQNLEQIPHQANIRNLEDRRIAVLVDRHDGTGVLDAGQMLDRAGNTDGDIKLDRKSVV